MRSSCGLVSLVLVSLLGLAAPARALTPDQIVLVVNRAEPAGMELARFYAQARGIDPSRILELDLPKTEEMPFDRYEREVPPAVRKFLREKGLDQSVRCLVTFYGVPLRISNRENGPADSIELRNSRETMTRLMEQIGSVATELESQAIAAEPGFNVVGGEPTLDALGRRTTAAAQAIERAINRAPDAQTRDRLSTFLRDMTAKVTAPLDSQPATRPTTAPADLLERPFDPAARQTLRELAALGGIFSHARLLQQQIDYFQTEATGSAVDNELALIFWPPHPRSQWQQNPLHARFHGQRAPRTLMVMRLDAPTPQLVKDIIANSLATEREGLKGVFAIDSRGLAPTTGEGKPDAMGIFDEKLRSFSGYLKEKSKTPVTLDTQPGVFPAEPKIENVALYTGWYSLQNYSPAFKFNRGAVGYHIASFELTRLHGPPNGQWVRNLLENGVVGTVGPVAEPYLHSFPLPEEFFPLLLTGRLTLAEVYWGSNPLTSWMQTFIGDPLYNPFAKTPVLTAQDLAPHLRALVEASPIQAPVPDGR